MGKVKQVKPAMSRGKVSGGKVDSQRYAVPGASKVKGTPAPRTTPSYIPQRIVARGRGKG